MSFEIKRARGKTAVFSGTKQYSNHIPSLQELCIQKLLNNVNRIEMVGDVPYFILRPVLTCPKVTVGQLKRIESFNPQIVDDPDSDEPWKVHCQRDFENRQPKHGETWRDLYERCERERDHKIEKIAKRIKRHEKKAIPARQAKVVDQLLPGGKSRAISSTTVITKTIRHHTNSKNPSMNHNMPTTSTTVVKREASMPNGSQAKKLKVAPLMQKTMQLMRNRFKR